MKAKPFPQLIPGLCIALGFLLLGLCIRGGMNDFKSFDRVVTVKGLAEMEVPADRVIWPLMYKEIGNDLSALYNVIGQKNRTVIDFLQKNGIEASEISVSAPEIIDMEAERYNENKPLYRYNVTSVLTVTSDKVEKIRKLMSEQTDLLKKGIAVTAGDYRYSVQYLFTRLNDIKPQMIEEATRNARASAEKFARDSESKLGKIRTATQGQFSINDRDANTPHIKTIRVVTTIEYFLKD